MKPVKWLTSLWRKFFSWYRNPIPGGILLRVEPATVLAIIALIGLATSFWGMGRGIGVEKVSVEMAQALRNAPSGLIDQVNGAYEANKIDGYEREVSLQRVEELRQVFNNAANIIEVKGKDEATNAAFQSLVEILMSYNPAGEAGSLFGVTSNAASTGRGLDMLYSIHSITNSLDSFELTATPFSQEEAMLAQQINEIMGQDADALFRARVREMIIALSRWYYDGIMDNPCDPQKVAEELRNELVSMKWGAHVTVYGPGEKWPTYEAFMDWMIQEAVAHLSTQDYAKTPRTASGSIEFEEDSALDLRYNIMTLSFPLFGGDVTGEINLEYTGSSENCPVSTITQHLTLTGVFDPLTGFTGTGTLVVNGVLYGGSNCELQNLSRTTPNFTWTGQLTPVGDRCEVKGIIVGPENSAKYQLQLD